MDQDFLTLSDQHMLWWYSQIKVYVQYSKGSNIGKTIVDPFKN